MSSRGADAGVEIVRTVDALRQRVAGWRREGERVGLVPTMGALHAGHMSLVAASMARFDRTVVTLFVNPRQFEDPGDLERYPRTEASDADKLANVGADLLYAPGADEMYPPGFATTVSVGGVSEGLCGAARPGHFDGVCTVVTMLFIQSAADGAFFGEKDYQQLQVVRRFTRDLDIPIEVIACPTVREEDGLALSSRNSQLDPAARRIAPTLYRVLCDTATKLATGEEAAPLVAAARRTLLDSGFSEVDYVEMRTADSLEPLARMDRPARLLAAAWLGDVRLIDNVPVRA